LFALVVFVCDEYFVPKENVDEEVGNCLRFLKIMVLIPMDVQTIICNMAYGSSKQFVLSKDSEPVFLGLIEELRLADIAQRPSSPPPPPPPPSAAAESGATTVGSMVRARLLQCALM
jgi:hypothetical protein